MTIGPTSLLDVQNMLAEASREINRMRERAERAEANARDWEGNFIDMQAERDRLREALEEAEDTLTQAYVDVNSDMNREDLLNLTGKILEDGMKAARRALEGEKP